MNNFELIIFDCDGVLVDSERLANKIFARILNEECGLSLSLEDMFNTFVGRSSQQCMEIIQDMTDAYPPAQLEERYRREINRALRDSVVAVHGIEKALAEISIPYCVASGGSHEKMRTTLGKTKLLNLFEGRLHSVADVSRGKPHPDVYQYAAKRMGCKNPSRCLVVEDSPTGVAGGVAAGMVVFGYAELMDEQKLVEAGAHHTFKQMSDLASEILRYEH